MLGAAFAGAAATVDPSVGNFKFYQNGTPTFKVVVGARAQASDYWNAAKLAELFGNLAYSDKAVVADTSGLSCGAGTGNASTCSVTGKGVTLEITTPAGATGQTGSVSIKTQLYDFLDVSQVTATTTRVNSASTLIGDGVNTGGYYISATNNPDISWKGKIDNVGSYTVTEEEGYYITGKSYYDTSQKKYVADTANVAYAVNFTDSIPYHVDLVNGTITGRPSNDAYLAANRNVKLRFLGQDYIITAFENTTTNSISLGSQAVALQMKVGQSVKLGDKEIRMVQISPIGTTSSVLPPAYFEIWQNGTKIDYFSMNKDTANYNKNGVILDVRDVFVGGGDSSYADMVAYSSSLTLTSGQKMSFEGDDATTKINDDANWIATLAFTTKTVGTVSSTGGAIKALQQIRLTRSTSSNKLAAGDSFKLVEKPVSKQLTFTGVEPIDTDTLRVIAGGTNRYTVTPNNASGINTSGSTGGLDRDINVTWLKSGYSSAFQINGISVDTLLIDEFNGNILYKDPNSANYTNVGTENNNVTYYYPSTTASGAIQVITNLTKSALSASNTTIPSTNCSNIGAASTNLTATSVVTIYAVDAAGGWSKPVNITNQHIGGMNLTFGTTTGAQKYNVFVSNATGAYPAMLNSTSAPQIDITSALTNSVICFGNSSSVMSLPSETSGTAMKVRIREPTTDNSATLDGYYEFDLFRNDASYLYNSSQTGALTSTYAAGATGVSNTLSSLVSGGASYEQGFVDPAGGSMSLLSLTEVNVKYPKKLAHAVWTFGSPSTVNVTAGGATVTSKTLAEVESYALGGGYSVKVLSVAGSASCAGAGGKAGALSGTATCAPASGAVVTPLNPATDSLVVMDSQAGGVGPAVVVGGPLVNTLSANTPGAAAIASAPGQSGVRVVGDKVFVYGYTAADTTDAVDALINWVASQRDAVRGV